MSIRTVSRLLVAASIGLFVAACQDDMRSGLGGSTKHLAPLKPDVLALMETKGMRKEDPILVRAFKEEKTLEIWKRDKSGRFALLKSYPLCTTGGVPGPKIREGDKQSPEGFYTVTPGRMNPNSQFYLSYDIGYPNAFDRAFGRTGAAIMVHGGCTGSAGCFIGTDEQISEIYALAREAFSGGQKSFQVQAYPFRMTAENLARHRKSPHLAFWKNIKQGHDHFEVTKLEPKVDVCDRKYVFDARTTDPNSTTFNPTGACPTYDVPHEISSAVAQKANDDEKAFKVAVAEIEDKDRKDHERAVADAQEKAKPQPGSQVASWLGGGSSQSEVVALAQPVAVDVPLPRPSPLGAPIAVAMATEQPAEPKVGGLAGRLFGFGAGEPAPADPAAAAVNTAPAFETASTARPVSVPLPAARPGAAVDTGPSTAAVTAPVEEKPLWKKINPFGG